MSPFAEFLSTLFASSVRRQLIWGVALVHAAMMSPFVYDLSLRQHAFLVQSQNEQAENLVQTLSVTAITPMLSSDLAGLQELVKAVGRYPGVVYAMALHTEGKILAHVDASRRGQFAADLSSFSRAKDDSPFTLSRTERLVDVVMPVVSSGHRLGWVRVGVGPSEAAVRLESVVSNGLIYTALAIGVGVVLAWWLAWRLTRRLWALAQVADSVRAGDLDLRSDPHGKDELSHLARAFNFMLDALQQREFKECALQAALQSEKDLAQVTLASIGDAVVTTDAQGQVTFLNAPAQALSGWSDEEARGQPVPQVIQLFSLDTQQPTVGPMSTVLGLVVEPENGLVAPEQDFTLLSRQGGKFTIEATATPIHTSEGAVQGGVLVFRDVSEKHRVQERLQWQAGHDVLTHLPNRMLLADRFERALDRARRQGSSLAVCMLDLDEFKPVNDRHGHKVGDALLVQVAARLLQELRGVDTLCRLGGDEFVVLFEDLEDVVSPENALQCILNALSQPFWLEDELSICVTASIGYTVYPTDASDADTLMRHADQAMYVAKQTGRNRFQQFDVSQDRQMESARQTIERVRQALLHDELCLFYQPKVNLRTGEVIGFEALLRWQHPQDGLVPPLSFLPQVEQSDVIIEIGEWVIDQVLTQLAQWRAQGQTWPVSVNLAARHFQSHGFMSRLQAVLARHSTVPPGMLEFEILESVALADVTAMNELMAHCQALGISFSLDDFGTGYSSLSYLKHLPAHTLKIDQSFVRNMRDDHNDLALVGAIVNIAQLFDRRVIAEGVETVEQGVQLLRMGCDLAQGYGIARPMPPNEVLGWVAQYQTNSQWQLEGSNSAAASA